MCVLRRMDAVREARTTEPCAVPADAAGEASCDTSCFTLRDLKSSASRPLRFKLQHIRRNCVQTDEFIGKVQPDVQSIKSTRKPRHDWLGGSASTGRQFVQSRRSFLIRLQSRRLLWPAMRPGITRLKPLSPAPAKPRTRGFNRPGRRTSPAPKRRAAIHPSRSTRSHRSARALVCWSLRTPSRPQAGARHNSRSRRS